MTQYPGQPPLNYGSPYQYPPGYGYDPREAALAPARRAGLMMIILGGLMLTGGLCCGATLFVPVAEIERQMSQMGSQVPQGVTAELIRIQLVVFTVAFVVLGLLMIVLGIPVRRGGRGVILISIILSSLMLLFTLLSIVAPLLTGGGMPDVIASACVSVVPMVLLTLLLVWLIQGYKGSGTLDAMQAQYNQQYWQYAQQQQMYGQGQYGVPPPPAQQPLPPRPIVDPQRQPPGEGHEPPKAP